MTTKTKENKTTKQTSKTDVVKVEQQNKEESLVLEERNQPVVEESIEKATLLDKITVESRPAKWLLDQKKSNLIMIDHSFQRNAVWGKKEQIGLVETVLLGMPIPEVYLWLNKIDNEGNSIYSIVDGQQRTNALTEFMDGKFKLSKSHLDFPLANYADKSFEELTHRQKTLIWNYKLAVRFMAHEINRDQIKSIFLRLNKTSMPLNQQELRHAAFEGKFDNLVDSITKNTFWAENGVFNAGDLRRMKDSKFVSQLLIYIIDGIETSTDEATINEYYKSLNKSFPESKAHEARFKEILKNMDEMGEGREFLQKAYRRSTHFYSVFTAIDSLMASEKLKDTRKTGSKLDVWFKHQSENQPFEDEDHTKLLEEYASLCLEGVQQKSNRQRRQEILLEYLK